jgi:hypothetical protein
MENLELDQIVENVKKDLNHQVISGRALLDRLCLIDERSRKTAPYLDHKYAPFYYHLGKYLKTKSFLEVGFNLGLLSCCFLTSCKSVEFFLGFKEKDEEYTPVRIGTANIKKFVKKAESYVGNLYDEELDKKLTKYDLILINEEKDFEKLLNYLDFFWPYLLDNGFLILEYVQSNKTSQKVLNAFCNNKNIKPIIFPTKYGTALIQKC